MITRQSPQNDDFNTSNVCKCESYILTLTAIRKLYGINQNKLTNRINPIIKILTQKYYLCCLIIDVVSLPSLARLSIPFIGEHKERGRDNQTLLNIVYVGYVCLDGGKINQIEQVTDTRNTFRVHIDGSFETWFRVSIKLKPVCKVGLCLADTHRILGTASYSRSNNFTNHL